jgi:type I restriction enzyme S subunit
LENEGWLVGPRQVLINLTAQSLEDGFMGRVCFTGDEDAGLLNQRIGRFILHNSILPEFFFRCLQTTRFRQVVEKRCEGSKVRHLYFRHFQDFLLPKLSKEQQRAICDDIQACEAAISTVNDVQEGLARLREAFINATFASVL